MRQTKMSPLDRTNLTVPFFWGPASFARNQLLIPIYCMNRVNERFLYFWVEGGEDGEGGRGRQARLYSNSLGANKSINELE